MRILIETMDTVRELNRWEIGDAAELTPTGTNSMRPSE